MPSGCELCADVGRLHLMRHNSLKRHLKTASEHAKKAASARPF